MKLVIYPAVEPSRLTEIRQAAADGIVCNCGDETSALAEMPDADALFGRLTPGLLAVARRLRWVQSPTASLEHYVFPALIKHPCVLTNMRGLFSDVIADHVFAYILTFARNLHVYLRNQIAGRWEPVGGESERSGFLAGPGVASAIDRAHLHLADCTLGIVGLGYIGAEVARRGRAFGMTVIAVDPQPVVPPEGVTVWTPDRLPDLLAASDFVVVAAPHTPVTEKLFRREQFAQMRSGAYFINIGRGAIVDLGDLTAALQDKLIAGAGLDVFETEPLPLEHPLWKMDNVLITPHIAGVSPRIAERHLAVVVENVKRFVRGESLLNVVNKRLWF